MRPWIIAFFILFTAFFAIQRMLHPQLTFNSVSDRITHPFDTRLRFKVAEVDPRFGLTHQQVVQLSKEAISIWHSGMHQDFFVYDDNASLQIKLIYDQRQEEYNALKKTEKQLNHKMQINQRSSDNIAQAQQNIDQLRNRILQRKSQLDFEYQQLQQELSTLTEQTGNHAEKRQQLVQKRWELEENHRQLEQEMEYFNQQNQQLNTQVNAHNQSVDQYNTDVFQAGKRFPPREFHKGVFMGDQIQIYQFDTADDLRLTLAHELGHALGIEHHSDPYALMYPILSEQNMKDFKLMPADMLLVKQR